MFVSLDGYAAGEEVTFDAPIGGARALFGWFAGRVIHGIDRVDDPVTPDRALFSTWGQGHGASQVPAAGRRVARRRLARLVARRASVPDTGVRPDPPPAPRDRVRQRDQFPLRGRDTRGGAPPGSGGRERRRRPDRRRP